MQCRWLTLALGCWLVGCSSSEPSPDPSSLTHGRCTPRYGASTGRNGFYRVEDLPSGTCTASEPCDMAAEQVCGCPSIQGPVSSFRCTCTSGQWKCIVLAQGAGICPLECNDAG